MPASDEKAVRCLEAKALVDEAQRLIRSNSASLLRLARISGVPYETLLIIHKGKARQPRADTLQKLRDVVANLRGDAVAQHRPSS